MKNQLGFLSKNYLRTAPKLPFAVRNSGSCSLGDDRFIIMGGSEVSDLSSFSNKIILYDPKTQVSLTSSLTLNLGVNQASAFSTDNGNAIICGGASSDVIKVTAQAQEYNYINDTLTIVGDMIEPRAQHMSSQLSDGRGYVFGGKNQLDTLLVTSERFSFKHKIFSSLSNWSVGQDNKILSKGIGEINICRGENNYFSYSPSEDFASTKILINEPQSNYGMFLDKFGMNIIFGGDNTNSASKIKKYDSQLDYEYNSDLTLPMIIKGLIAINNESGNIIAGGVTDTDLLLDNCFELKSIIKDIPMIETAFMGGEDLSSPHSDVISFNSRTELVRVIGSLPLPVTEGEGNTFEYNGDNYPIIMGGRNTIGGASNNIAYKIDLHSEVFSATSGLLPSARRKMMSANVTNPSNTGKRLFVTGGIDNSGNAKADSFYYNPTAQTFTSCSPNLTHERYGASMDNVNVNGTYHASLAGGYDLSDTMRDEIYDFDPQTQLFSTSETLPAPRAGMSAMGGNNLIYFAGGFVTLGTPTNIIFKYDYNSKVISTLSFNMVTNRMFHSSFMNNINEGIVFGGESNSAIESSIEKINFRYGYSAIISNMSLGSKSGSTSGRTNNSPLNINLLPKSNFSVDSEKNIYNSGNSSVKLKNNKTQNYEIFVNEGDIVHTVFYLRKSSEYLDSDIAACAPKITLIGCGGIDSIIADTVTDSSFTQYDLTITALKSGLVELIVSNRSEKNDALIYIDDIGIG